jgi:formylglycine-generating enzyme required for sulfatase activity
MVVCAAIATVAILLGLAAMQKAAVAARVQRAESLTSPLLAALQSLKADRTMPLYSDFSRYEREVSTLAKAWVDAARAGDDEVAMQKSYEEIGKSARERCAAAVRAIETYGTDADVRSTQLQKAMAQLGASPQDVDSLAAYWAERNAEWNAMEADCAKWSGRIVALDSVRDGELKTAVTAAKSAFASARAEWQAAIARRGGVEGCRQRAERVYQQLMRDAAASEKRLLEAVPLVGGDAIREGFVDTAQWQAWRNSAAAWDLPSDIAAAIGAWAVIGCEEVADAESNAFLRHKATGIDLVAIEAGSFMMGSKDGSADERPLHAVRITRPFWIGKTEVTQAQYEAMMRRNPSHFASGSDAGRRPVECVSWSDAMAFCQSMSVATINIDGVHYGFRLPTEAEWEYCCRAGTTTKWHMGEALTATQANFEASQKSKTTPAGSYGANAWGLFDMHGNVREWCLDAWDGSANYPSSAVYDPYVSSGPYRVIRGGGWSFSAVGCRSAFRSYGNPGGAGSLIGFRVVLAPVLVK